MTLYPSDGGLLTGTPDKDYNILRFTEACLGTTSLTAA
jgi:hypothetical protein